MANEHVLVTQKTFPVSMTVANGTGIEKGSLLKLTDPNTAIIHSGENDPIAGIAYTEKIASDGNTKIAVLVGPGDILKATASGSITVHDPLMAADGEFVNRLYSVKNLNALEISGGTIVGTSLETATTGETFKYILNISAIAGDIA